MSFSTISTPPSPTLPLTAAVPRPKWVDNLPAVLVFLGALALFYSFWVAGIDTDIQLHTDQLRSINLGQAQWPPNFLLYLLVGALSGFSTDFDVLMAIMIVILALAVAGKFMVTRYILRTARDAWTLGQMPWPRGGATGIALMLTIAYLLPGRSYWIATNLYLHRIVPNVWHNSTLIAVFPFALLLFWEEYRTLELSAGGNAKPPAAPPDPAGSAERVHQALFLFRVCRGDSPALALPRT